MSEDEERPISSPSAKYTVDRVLGEGGMKCILRAFDMETRRDVAMAVMIDPAGQNRDAFMEEARLTARLEHPNIVPIHEIGTGLSGEPYFTMKLLNGVDLARILERLSEGDRKYLKRFPLRSLLEILLKVCDAVSFAHSKGVIHRDLKPENVQVGEYGEVLVLDWGLAKSLAPLDSATSTFQRPGGGKRKSHRAATTTEGIVKGTPAYMAPEQAAGRNATKDFRTDVYALGAILYSILTFNPPVAGADSKELIANVLHSRIIPARRCAPKGRQIPQALELVAYKAMNRNPAKRYQTVDEFKAEIEAYLAGFATRAEDASLPTQLWLLLKRKRSEAILLTCAFAAIMLVAGFLLFHIEREREKVARALAELQVEKVQNKGLVERMSQESRREWRLLFEESFQDKYLLERWTVNLPQNAQIAKDGLHVSSSGSSPLKLFLRRPITQDSARLVFEIDSLSSKEGGSFEIFVQGVAPGEGYSFRFGGLRDQKVSVARGQGVEPFAEAALALPEGRRFQALVEVQREADGAKLRLELDGREILSAKDSAPPPLNATSRSGISVNGASLVLHDMQLYALDAPMKAELLDIATRHLNKGDYSTAAALFAELAESSPEPEKRAKAAEGLRLAKLFEDCKNRLPEWRKGLERAWPGSSCFLSVDRNGLQLEASGRISSLAPLAGIPVSGLKLRSDFLQDLGSLEGMKLNSLDISGCPVKSLSPLSRMPLESLAVSCCPLESLAPLQQVKTLKRVLAKDCKLSSLDGLRGLALESLDCSDNKIESLAPLDGMPLESLDCSGNPLKGLPDALFSWPLQSLDANSCGLAALPPLASSKLRRLSAASNSLSSLDPLRGAALQELVVDANQIEDVAALQSCKRLECLSLSWNRISSLAPLAGMKLRRLYCDGNYIESLEPLRGMSSLKDFSIQSNYVQRLEPLSGLAGLSDLDVSANPLGSIAPLDALSLDKLLCGECPVIDFGKSLAYPPRKLFLLDCDDLQPGFLPQLKARLGSGPYAKALESSLDCLDAFKSGKREELRDYAFEADGRLFVFVPTLRDFQGAADSAAAIGAFLPKAGRPELMALLAKRFDSSFWTDGGSCVSDAGELSQIKLPKKLLPLLLELPSDSKPR